MARASLLTLLCPEPGIRARDPAGNPRQGSLFHCVLESREFTPRRWYGEKKRDSNGSAGWWGLPGSAPRQEEGTRAGRERRQSPAPAQRAAEGRGPLGKAGLALPAAPCPAAPGITSSDGRARSPAPAACQRRRRRPTSLSHNSAPRLRYAGSWPPPEPVLTMVKVPLQPLLIFFPPSLKAFQGPLVGLQTARSAAAA